MKLSRFISLRERFCAQYIPEPNSGCWLWTGTVTRLGYGMIGDGGGLRSAHRVSYELHRGDIGNNHVLHRCDNRCCVNPDHLFLGTHRENMADMRDKGRAPRAQGSAHHQAKLTERDVRNIRADRSDTDVLLAARFGVSPSTIGRIKSRRAWRHIP